MLSTLLISRQVNQCLSCLTRKIEALEATLQRKELCTAAMIHELRQPLNSVIGGIDLLSISKCLSLEDKRNVQIA